MTGQLTEEEALREFGNAVVAHGADYYAELAGLMSQRLNGTHTGHALAMLVALQMAYEAVGVSMRAVGGVPPRSRDEMEALVAAVDAEIARRRTAS